MRVPIRKGGQYTNIKSDPYMTKAKFVELKKRLLKLKKDIHPELVKEVKRLALMGDFSENTAYQIAKGRLRSTNYKIDKISKQIIEAKIIKMNKGSLSVQIGSLVSIKSNKQTIKYSILGSSESNPSKGTISYQSPLGKLLLHKSIGDIAKLKLNNSIMEYKIIKIE